MPKRKKVDTIPEEFNSYEEAAEFWDTHDSMDYNEYLEKVEMEVDIKKKHYLIEIDSDIAKVLKKNAVKKGIPEQELASELLQKQLVEIK